MTMIEVIVNDRLGTKDTVGEFKVLVAAQTGTNPSKMMIFCNRYKEFKDHITLADYEIHDGMSIELQ
ncbi:ubiquitin-like protein [Melampsora americana]|nr:ubiquitin-like protein [Melampsora americana]